MISIMVHMVKVVNIVRIFYAPIAVMESLDLIVTDFDALITEISLTAQYSFQCSDQSGRGQLAMSTG